MTKAKSKLYGFTIIELLVVIVVIGILAAITIVSYSGVSQKAIATSLQSDLNGAATKLKMYQVEYSGYPTAIVLANGLYCPNPDLSGGRYCFKASPNNSFETSAYTGDAQTFNLKAKNGSTSYIITNNTGPTLAATITVTGGIATTLGNDTIRTFTTNDTLIVTGGVIPGANVLSVGGGGSGGGGGWMFRSGGGGGGQVRTDVVTLSGSMPVVVGASVAGGLFTSGLSGNPSSFAGNTAIGGGFGASAAEVGGNGASGGGGAPWYEGYITAGGIGSLGYNGGSARGVFNGGAGGGGGMGSVGINGTSTVGGNGGAGISSTIYNGNPIFYGAGGGGGGVSLNGIGGSGKGGDANEVYGGDAAPNSGSGGGGGYGGPGGTGAAGIVIIRYPTP